MTHAVLRLLGSRRRWTSSVAVSLYAGRTFATLAMLVALALTVALAVTGLLARVAPLPTMQLMVMLKSKGPVPFFELRF